MPIPMSTEKKQKNPERDEEQALPNEQTRLLAAKPSPSFGGGSSIGSNDASFGATSESSFSVKSINVLPGMKIRAHQIDRKGHIRSCSVKEALKGAATPKPKIGPGLSYWIDIDADDRDSEELQEFLSQPQLNLSEFLVQRLSQPAESWNSQCLTFETSLLVVFRVLPTYEESEDIIHMACLLMKSLVLTFTSCNRIDTGGLYANALHFIHSREKLPDPTPNGLLASWLLFHLERTSRATRQLRLLTLKMDADMDNDIHSVEVDDMIQAKEQTLTLLYVAEEQLEVIQQMAAAEKEAVLDFSRMKGTLGVLLATSASTERMATRIEKHLSELRHRLMLHEQEDTNRRLAVLTIISAIFLPLTLLTGIWGEFLQPVALA